MAAGRERTRPVQGERCAEIVSQLPIQNPPCVTLALIGFSFERMIAVLASQALLELLHIFTLEFIGPQATVLADMFHLVDENGAKAHESSIPAFIGLAGGIEAVIEIDHIPVGDHAARLPGEVAPADHDALELSIFFAALSLLLAANAAVWLQCAVVYFHANFRIKENR